MCGTLLDGRFPCQYFSVSRHYFDLPRLAGTGSQILKTSPAEAERLQRSLMVSLCETKLSNPKWFKPCYYVLGLNLRNCSIPSVWSGPGWESSLCGADGTEGISVNLHFVPKTKSNPTQRVSS